MPKKLIRSLKKIENTLNNNIEKLYENKNNILGY